MHTTATNRIVVWVLLGIALLVNIAGYAFNLYQRISWFDEALHAYTLFAVTLALGLFAYGVVLTGARDRRLWLILTIAAFGIAIAGLWEIGEWAYDQVSMGNDIKGKRDTITDMIMGDLGALVAGGLASTMVTRAREGAER